MRTTDYIHRAISATRDALRETRDARDAAIRAYGNAPDCEVVRNLIAVTEHLQSAYVTLAVHIEHADRRRSSAR